MKRKAVLYLSHAAVIFLVVMAREAQSLQTAEDLLNQKIEELNRFVGVVETNSGKCGEFTPLHLCLCTFDQLLIRRLSMRLFVCVACADAMEGCSYSCSRPSCRSMEPKVIRTTHVWEFKTTHSATRVPTETSTSPRASSGLLASLSFFAWCSWMSASGFSPSTVAADSTVLPNELVCLTSQIQVFLSIKLEQGNEQFQVTHPQWLISRHHEHSILLNFHGSTTRSLVTLKIICKISTFEHYEVPHF